MALAARAIPRFALYGETGRPGEDLLHIEELQTRSRLYQWEIDAHVHPGLFQIVWLQQGDAQVALDEWHGGVVGPAAIVVPPGVVHGFHFAAGTDGHVLTVSARLLVEGEFQSIGEAFRVLFSAPGVLDFSATEVDALRLAAQFAELAVEFGLPGAGDTPVPQWLARAIIWRLARTRQLRQAQTVQTQSHHALYVRFVDLVEQHFLEHWPMQRYANRLGLSTQRLNRLIGRQAGRSALQLVHERLLREACRRLIYTAVPATRLAFELGFEDPAYFSRFFKRHTGLSPQRWRQAHHP
jgi:AraC family transcriptional regulator, transcriptional activator of pobA